MLVDDHPVAKRGNVTKATIWDGGFDIAQLAPTVSQPRPALHFAVMYIFFYIKPFNVKYMRHYRYDGS